MTSAEPRVALLATLDTKPREAGYVRDRIAALGCAPVVVNIGRDDSGLIVADFDAKAVQDAGRAATAGDPEPDSQKVAIMERSAAGAQAVLEDEIAAGRLSAVIGIGGGQGSWIGSRAMRPLPVGFPKLLVSTAGRDAGQFTQFSDIVSVFSITDVAGLNPLLRKSLDNAAAAVCGMARHPARESSDESPLVAISVYGITTAGANVAMDYLRARGVEPVSFHTNGVGGPTMEAQIRGRAFQAVLDWSTTEIADDVVGGVCAAGPERLTNAGRLGLPQVIVPGGLDVVNFGAPDSMPEHLRGRLSYAHTADATLLRTNVDENRAIAAVMAERLTAATGPVAVVIPRGGFSALSGVDGPLFDRAADAAFEETLRGLLPPEISVSAYDANINDPAFAELATGIFFDLVGSPVFASSETH